MNWRNRSACFVLLGIAIGLHLQAQAAPVWMWGLVLLQFGLYPHVLYALARRASRPLLAERVNMLLDAMCMGFWSAWLGFPLWIAFPILLAMTANLVVFMGKAGVLGVLVSSASGIALAGLLLGWRWQPHVGTVPMVFMMCALTLFIVVFAYQGFVRSSQLAAKKRQLQAQLQEIEALKNVLADQALRDSLTGLYNRRKLEQVLPPLMRQCRRQQQGLVLMLLDLDAFKQVNDQLGHIVGDDLIKSLAQHLVKHCRAGDDVFRLAGDEFVVVFSNTSMDVAMQRAQHICRSFSQHPRRVQDLSITASISCGLAQLSSTTSTLRDLLKQADQALYASKRKGRDTVTHFETESI